MSPAVPGLEVGNGISALCQLKQYNTEHFLLPERGRELEKAPKGKAFALGSL